MSIDYLGHVRGESVRFLAALLGADLSRSVPTCPDWTAADLTGTAEDLDAWIWHRRDDSGLRVEGDPTAYQRLLTLLQQPIR